MSRASSSAAAVAVRDAAPLFAALGDETRLRLLTRLSSGGPQSVASLCEKADVSRQAISKHLEVLSGAGLVKGTRQGRERIWQLTPERLDKGREYLDRIGRQWDDAIDRLRELVEDSE